MADLSQITLPNGSSYDLKDAKKTGIYPVIGTQTAATGSWTGAINVPALYAGLTIMYYLPWAPSGNATLNLTLSDGTTTGAKNCYYNTGRLTTHYGKGSNIVMTYWPAGSIKVDGTATTDDRWIANANYDSNSIAYRVTTYYNRFKAGANKIFPYTIIMQCADGRWESIVTSSSTGTSKTRNTHGFRLGQLALMYANATYNENATVGDNTVWEHGTDLIDHRYSFNTANNSTNGTTAVKPVYLVGALNASDGLFYLDTTWWTQTLPTSDDGKLYIYLGDAYDYYRMSFRLAHPIYWYKNGAIRLFTQDAATVTGHTVAKDVPSDAVFTDHTYNFSGTTFYSGNSSSAEHNCNNAVKNGHYYYTSNGPTTTLGASTADGALYTQSYSDAWVAQIAQDYRNGNIFVRGKNNGTWQAWKKVDAGTVNGLTVQTAVPTNAVFTDTTYTASTTSIGSASAGTAIAADDITAWDAGTVPTLGTAIAADDITAWSAGTVPTLGTAIAADDITAWSAGIMFSASVSGKKLVLSAGTAPSLSYTARSIPNVTSVGTAPSLSYTARSIPNVTSVGTAPSLSYTARSIPNISVTSKTVVTGITAN